MNGRKFSAENSVLDQHEGRFLHSCSLACGKAGKIPRTISGSHTSTITTGEPNELCGRSMPKDDEKLENVFENDEQDCRSFLERLVLKYQYF
jgi:hypothetical protein